MWGDTDPPNDSWQTVSSSLDISEAATAVDIAAVMTNNSK